MTERPKGLLLAMMEPPSALEEEFNDWYDTEHVPERAAIPGFETALRFVCIEGWPRYVAVYDLTYPEVLDEPGYLAVSHENFSPWTKRLTTKVRGQYRAAGPQVYPGQAVTTRLSRLVIMRLRDVQPSAQDEIVEGTVRNFAAREETLQVRVYRNDIDGRTDYLALIDAQAPFELSKLDLSAYGSSRSHIDLVNTYVPHWRRGPLRGVY
jgi:hypothetical protein